MNKRKFAEEILKGLKDHATKEDSPRILVVFTGTNSDLDRIIKDLKKGKRDFSVEFLLAFSWNAKNLMDIDSIKRELGSAKVYTEENKQDPEKLLSIPKQVFWPMATQNSVAKLAQGIQDDFISTLLWHSLWKSIPLHVRRDTVVSYRGKKSDNPVLQGMVEENLKKLEKMGATIHDRPDYYELIKKAEGSMVKPEAVNASKALLGKSRVITERDLILLMKENREVILPENSVLTPLAKDFLRSKQIKP